MKTIQEPDTVQETNPIDPPERLAIGPQYTVSGTPLLDVEKAD